MADFGDPLLAGAVERQRRASLDRGNSKQLQGGDFQAELQKSDDPSKVLACWCIEGRPRITAALADDGSLLRLAAQLLCETTVKSFGASASDKQAVELRMLRAAFSYKTSHFLEAASEFRAVSINPEVPSIWRRRAFAALGWALASAGDHKACAKSGLLDGKADANLDPMDQYALFVASTRIRVELGDASGARKDFENAKQLAESFQMAGDCRLTMAEARVCFAEGDIDSAAKLWHSQTHSKTVSLMFPPVPDESISSYISAFAIAAVVGDLGDFIIEGSRAARHEASNNFAVCALHAGRLDGAVIALEEVLKSFGAPQVVDSVAAMNLRTLYELCRTPENLRLLS